MSDPNSDENLFQGWTSGDEHSGEALCRRYARRLTRLVRSKVSRGDVEDVVQQVWCALLTSWRRNPSGQVFRVSFRAYLYGVLRNVLFAHLRAKYRLANFEPLTSSILDVAPSLSEELTRRAAAAHLASALQTLPLDSQILLELRYREELSTAELAEMYGAPTGTIKSRLRLARHALERKMSSSGWGRKKNVAEE